MRHLVIIISLVTFYSSASFSQNLTGRYSGAVTRDGSIQLVNFDFYFENNEQKGSYEIPELGIFETPIDQITIINDTLNIKFYYGNFYCFADLENGELTGISEYWLPKIRLHLKKTPLKQKPYTKEDISFMSGNVKISGMIFHPKEKLLDSLKYVVLVHGSGYQTRYTSYYVSMAYSLSLNGIGVLLYDKRGTGKSEGDYSQTSMYDLAEDAYSALEYLKNRNDLNLIEIGMLATSQGGWIAPISANKSSSCDFLILNVSPSVSVFEQDIHRVKYTMMSDGWKEQSIDSALYYTQLYFDFAKHNKTSTWKELERLVSEYKSKEWAEYLNFPENQNDFSWWRLNDFDPSNALSNLKCRTLCIYGEHDRLVPPQENIPQMNYYLKLAGIEFEILTIEGAYHNMQTSQGLNGTNWNWPIVYWLWRKQPEEYIQSIIEFIERD